MASVLVFYGFHVKYICAALLSAAFTHMPKVSDDKQKCIAYVDTFLAKTPGQHISIAKAYSEASAAWYGSGEKIWESPNEVISAQPLILFAAHALELTLSGEVEATARTDAMLPHLFSSIQHVMRALGLVGFCNALPKPHPNYRPSIVGCFRIVGEAFHPMFIDAALKST